MILQTPFLSLIKWLSLLVTIMLSVMNSSYASQCSIIGSPAIVEADMAGTIGMGVDVGTLTSGTTLSGTNQFTGQTGTMNCSGGNTPYAEGYLAAPTEQVGGDKCLWKVPLTTGEYSGLAVKIWYDLGASQSTPNQYCMGYPANRSTFRYEQAKLGATFRVDLVAYGDPIKAGTLNFDVFKQNGITWDGVRGAGIDFTNEHIVINTLSCDLTTPDVTVNMTPNGPIDANTTFTGINSTSSPVDFQILLNCPQQDTNISINFSAAQITGSNTDILVLDNNTADSTAKGIGIQLKTGASLGGYGGIIVPFNKPASSAMPLFKKTSTTGTIALPFTAQYIQTENTVTPGRADATTTFQVFYP